MYVKIQRIKYIKYDAYYLHAKLQPDTPYMYRANAHIPHACVQ